MNSRISQNKVTLEVSQALIAEGVPFPIYATLSALSEAGGALRLCSIAKGTGQSYHAAHHQAERSPWFSTHRPTKGLVEVRINEEGRIKLSRIRKRLAPQEP